MSSDLDMGHSRRSGVGFRFFPLAAAILCLSCQTTGTGTTLPASAAESPNPRGARGPLAYVSDEESNEISVIDGTADTLLTRIFVGKRPRGIKLSPHGKSLFSPLN